MNLNRIDYIGIPVTDLQRALDFYTQVLGLEERVNMEHFEIEGSRWIELVPPGAVTSIVLAPWEHVGTAGSLVLLTDDIEADYAELTSRGLEMPPLEMQPWGTAVPFKDPDGNSWYLQQNMPMEE
ncbi:MAG: VOC family protein [Chloroflexota bacterium]